MQDDEHQAERQQRLPVFPVAPVRARHAVPREVLVALVVGVVAFVGGILVATSDPAGGVRAKPAASEVAGPSATTAADIPPAPTSSSDAAFPEPDAALPGSSAFVRGFRPAALVAALPHGSGCVTTTHEKEVPRSLSDGPPMTFQRSWTIYCPLPVKLRQSFLLALIESLVRDVPADTYGYSANLGGSGDALLPYAEHPLGGTVALTADAAGPGLSIVIVLQEWRSG